MNWMHSRVISVKQSCCKTTHNKRLKHRGLRPLDSQQVARRLGDSYALTKGELA